jgi:hypothetical protein
MQFSRSLEVVLTISVEFFEIVQRTGDIIGEIAKLDPVPTDL